MIHKPSLESLDVPQKFGADRFSRFDVYGYKQTNKQHPDRETSNQSIYIDGNCNIKKMLLKINIIMENVFWKMLKINLLKNLIYS